MTEAEFRIDFLNEFPELAYLHTEWKAQSRINDSFIQYLIETVFRFVESGNEYGFSGDKYSEEDDTVSDTIARYGKANQYTFDYLKENKELLTFILL